MLINKIAMLYIALSFHSAFCTNDGLKDENTNVVIKSVKKRKDCDNFNANTYNIHIHLNQALPKGKTGYEEDDEDFNYEKLQRFVFLEKQADGNISLLNFVKDKK
jgi:hypothetical protein